ncbi:MAG: peptide-methionine (S)-S-oxide reductase MsrA [Methylovulum sp.]
MLLPLLLIMLTCCSLTSANAAENVTTAHLAKATFSGGCFWCMEQPFDLLPGVIETTPGYTGGDTANPTYETVSSGATGHVEAVQIVYNPAKISYEKLLEVFWRNIDPTKGNGQFCDEGSQYRANIFYHDEDQKRLAEQSKTFIEKNKHFSGSIKTQIIMATEFFPAEKYHQDYYRKNPWVYKFYRFTCGRDSRLKQLWGN